MKKIVLLLFIACSLYGNAQTPGWLWLKGSGGGSGYQYGGGVGTDDSGNVYIGGRLNGTITFGSKSETAGGTNHLYGKFDKDGNCLWLSQSAIDFDYPRGFCTDRAKKNNVYQAGNVKSGQKMFVEKVNNDGVLVWSKTLGSGYDYGTAPNADGIAADSAGNVYVTGETGGGSGTNWTFGDSVLNYSGTGINQEMFLTRMDMNGNFLWAVGAVGVNASSGGYDVGRGITLSKSNRYVFVSGGYTGTPSFHSKFSTGNYTAPTAVNGTSSLFVAKYDTAGNLVFVTTATNAGIPWISPFNSGVGPGNAVTTDSCDNIYVTGHYRGTAQFGPFTLTATNTNGQSDGFVACCNSKGQWQWVNDIGSNSTSQGDFGQQIVLDKNGDIYVSGQISGTANFGNGVTVTASSTGGSLFIAKYANSNGAAQWAQGPAGTSASGVGGLAVDDDGFAYICGSFSGTITLGSTTVTATTGNGNIYVAKLDTVPARYIVPVVDSSYCQGTSSTIPFTIAGTFNAGNVFTAQLSDSTGSFASSKILGTDTSTTGGTINITIPQSVSSGSNYLIRVVSSNPITSSYVNGCGAYYQQNVYLNNFYVTIGSGLVLKISNDTAICSGNPVQLNVVGGSTFTWSPGSTLNDSTIANPVAIPATSQTYSVVVHNGNCVSSRSVFVGVTPSYTITITPKNASVCSGNNIPLNATGGVIFLWSPAFGLTCTNCSNPTATPTITTTYTIMGGPCTATVTKVVTVGTSSIGGAILVARDTICKGTSGNLELSGNSSDEIQWQSSVANNGVGGYTNVATGGGRDTTKFRTDPLNESSWFRALVGTEACEVSSDSVELVVPPSLTASFTSTSSGTTVTFSSQGSIGNISGYFWDFGDGAISTDSTPTHTYAKDTIYNPCLTIYDGSNCSYTVCQGIALGMVSASAEGNWIIYPNPFNNEINIDRINNPQEVKSIEMVDMLGREVINEQIGNLNNSSIRLETSVLAKGIYYIKIRTVAANYVEKVVKE